MTGTIQRSSSRRARAFVLAPLLVLAISALASVAQADPDPLAKPTNAVARDHLTTGNRLYRLREFEKAIEEYKAGAVREDVPVFHYNLGQCYRQLGRHEDAIWHYERFLERGKPTGEVEASVRDFIAQMKGELEKQATKQPPGGPAPPTSSVSTSPGQPLPIAPRAEAQPGMPPRRELAIGIGVGGVESRPRWYADRLGWGLVAGGVAFAGGATYLRVRASHLGAEALVEMYEERRRELHDAASVRGAAGVVLGVGGAALIAAGVIKLMIHAGPPPRGKAASWRLGTSGRGVAVLGQF